MKNKKIFIRLTTLSFLFTASANLAHAVTAEKNASLGFQTFFFSMMFMFMSLGQIFGSNSLGYISDKHGRKKIMFFGAAVYAISQLGFGFSTNPILILFFRILAGFSSSGVFVSLNAYLIDITDSQNRFTYMTKFMAISSLGTSLGFFVGGIVGRSEFIYTFIFQSIILLIVATSFLLFLKEEKTERVLNKKDGFFMAFKKINNPLVYTVLFSIFVAQFGFVLYNNSSQQYLKLSLDFTPEYIGYYMAFSGVLGLIMNLIVFPKLKNHFSPLIIAVFTFLTIIISSILVTYNLDTKNNIFMLFLMIFLLSISLFNPLLTAFLSKACKDNNGLVMGIRQSITGFAAVLASLFIGIFFDLNNYIIFISVTVSFVIALIPILLFSKQLR